jgi:hypothetical protein
VRWLAKGNAVGQADFIAGLFGLAASDRIQTTDNFALILKLRKKTGCTGMP